MSAFLLAFTRFSSVSVYLCYDLLAFTIIVAVVFVCFVLFVYPV